MHLTLNLIIQEQGSLMKEYLREIELFSFLNSDITDLSICQFAMCLMPQTVIDDTC